MNIVYFNPDQMRADFLSCYGNRVARTPHLDSLAGAGVRFEQCHVQHTVCTPSRCSFMTGWYPHVRGHRTLWYPLQPDEPNTLKYLKSAGYEVHWIGKNDLLAQRAFEDSVSALHFPQGGDSISLTALDEGSPGYRSFLYPPLEGHNGDWYKVDEAIRFLESRKPSDPPFFLYLPIQFPHCPFTCPEPWYSMYDPDSLAPTRPEELPNKPVFHRLLREYRRLDSLDSQVLRKARAVYMGMISYVDEMVGRLVDAVRRLSLWDETAFFFFSDHGEWGGDYGLIEKWHGGLDDCLTHVPMIVRTPDCTPGHTVAEPIECFDIMPTTLELAGLEARHTHFGRSMVDQLHGADGDLTRAVFAEGGYDPNERHCYEGVEGWDSGNVYYPKGLLQQEHPESSVRATMIRTRDFKLIHRPNEVCELYDLAADPEETANRYDDSTYGSVRAALERRLLDWYVHTSDVVPHERQLRGYSNEVISRFGVSEV